MSYRCAICQEALENAAAAAIKCGHTFHFHCISQWCDRSRTCPSCRFSIRNFDKDVFSNLFFDKYDTNSELSTIVDDDADSKIVKKLKQQFNLISSQLSDAKSDVSEKERELRRASKSEQELLEKVAGLEREASQIKAASRVLREKCSYFDNLKDEKENLEKKYQKYKTRCHTLENFNNFMKSPSENADQWLNEMKSGTFDDLKPFIINLKRTADDTSKSYKICLEKLNTAEKNLKDVKRENAVLAKKVKDLTREVKLLHSRPNQTPFNSELKSILAESPDTPQMVSTTTNDSTPMFKKENLPKIKPALSSVYQNLNNKKPSSAENVFYGDEILRDPTRNTKKMRPDGVGGSIRACSLFNEKNLLAGPQAPTSTKATMKRSASSTNVVSERKKPSGITKLTDFPMRSNISHDDSVEFLN